MEKSKHEGGHRDRAAESRHRLLLAGMAQFAEKGYDGASVRGIVGSVGCSVPAISSYFGGKEGLAKAIVAELKRTIVLPAATDAKEIGSDLAWRVAVKRFVQHVVEVFNAEEEPNCYFAALYRHESAHLHGKKVTLHEEIVKPLFCQLEKLIALGVANRSPIEVRLWTLALWNNVLAYALKHPDVVAEDIPEGIEPRLFRETNVDFMVDKCIRDLRFTAA